MGERILYKINSDQAIASGYKEFLLYLSVFGIGLALYYFFRTLFLKKDGMKLISENTKLREKIERIEEELETKLEIAAENEFKYRQLFDSTLEGIVIADKGKIIEVNKIICEMIGYKQEELVGKTMFEFIDPDYLDILKKEHGSPGTSNYEIQVIKKNGDKVLVEVLSREFFFEGEDVRVAAIRDISNIRKIEKSERDNLKFLETLMETIPNPIFYKNTDGIYTGCNNAYAELLGMSREEIIGASVYDIAPKNLAYIYYRADKDLFENPGKQVYEAKFKDSKGVEKDVIFTKATFEDEDGCLAGLVGVIVDISSYKKVQEKLMDLSIRDPLTMLYNRAGFRKMLKEEFEKSERQMSIIMIDIDYFKKINDTYGHFCGDQVLINISSILTGLSGNQYIVSRWGGEEFLILCTNTDIHTAAKFAEEARKAVEVYEFDRVKTVTCSFGVTAFREEDTLDAFINRSDKAMYKAKNSGKNKVVVV